MANLTTVSWRTKNTTEMLDMSTVLIDASCTRCGAPPCTCPERHTCGAPTMDGGECGRAVKEADLRCWQHRN